MLSADLATAHTREMLAAGLAAYAVRSSRRSRRARGKGVKGISTRLRAH